MKSDLLEIINNYGLGNQLKKISEEIYEFQEAVLLDDGSQEALNHILEEFSDVMVLMEEFKIYFELDNDLIIETMKYKVNRQIGRMKKESDK